MISVQISLQPESSEVIFSLFFNITSRAFWPRQTSVARLFPQPSKHHDPTTHDAFRLHHEPETPSAAPKHLATSGASLPSFAHARHASAFTLHCRPDAPHDQTAPRTRVFLSRSVCTGAPDGGCGSDAGAGGVGVVRSVRDRSRCRPQRTPQCAQGHGHCLVHPQTPAAAAARRVLRRVRRRTPSKTAAAALLRG